MSNYTYKDCTCPKNKKGEPLLISCRFNCYNSIVFPDSCACNGNTIEDNSVVDCALNFKVDRAKLLEESIARNFTELENCISGKNRRTTRPFIHKFECYPDTPQEAKSLNLTCLKFNMRSDFVCPGESVQLPISSMLHKDFFETWAFHSRPLKPGKYKNYRLLNGSNLDGCRPDSPPAFRIEYSGLWVLFTIIPFVLLGIFLFMKFQKLRRRRKYLRF